jgi:two-component system, NarL family, nitrate/nitrite response regulator NarL
LSQDIRNHMDKSRKAIHVLISDAHTLFRETLKKVLESERDFLFVGEAGDGEETLRLVELLDPDILLMDWKLPRLSSMEVLRSLSDSGTKTRAILLTGEIEPDQIKQAFEFGARGLVLKVSETAILFESMRQVKAGHYWMGSESCSSLEQILRKLSNNAPESKRPKNFALTQQELKVVAAVASGHTNREIARQFSISEQTVKHHITNIFDKLGVYNRLELTLFALHHKLIQDSD